MKAKRVSIENLIFQSKMRALLWIWSVYNESTAAFWRPPPRGWLKFNVCGVAKDGRAGSGGVLSDKEGVARALFSGSVAANDADVPEAGAVKVALEVFLTMNWKTYDSLFIELGSLVCFLGADKKGNELAFSLVIAGVNREKMFKAWW
ncbi:hypothetical protein ES288_A03G011700v1 [Gossypium darwinii]|uniref:RNase H type-1 domain-containing protein n=1 Tax=Gossypium darwinii TaxID=34276 RepID=A0A5D2GZV0_GOSDA|nr:hypothetical protein ES288_A03G011700v1 [Gossypium darwinii]